MFPFSVNVNKDHHVRAHRFFPPFIVEEYICGE